ncbi:alpha/beta hydrolase [uncultured Parabacteroides sp.]|uniref:alpha/beta hydrolase n=1 Tax=uncultured Parabacteroides sp. TaxID=512312 RepID=UPI002659BD3E|nr:alpha/beta hydrolase-fold protein [uncultured Parabacteroides sp.]
MRTKAFLLCIVLLFAGIYRMQAQADFYSIQALGHRYIYNSDYFDEPRELQVYLSGVDGSLKNDSLLAIYVFDAQYPPTYNLFCSTFELIYPNTPCVIVGISNSDRQSELTPPFTDSISVKGYSNPGHGKEMLLSLTNEIIPFIEKKYHTSHDRVLAGHSLGGTFVSYAMMEYPALFPHIIAISPNYNYSKNMMIDKLRHFTDTYRGEKELYVYLANGHKDKTEEKFKPMIKEACSIIGKNNKIELQYDSLNIDKHSATIFEGYYRGLLKMASVIKSTEQQK